MFYIPFTTIEVVRAPAVVLVLVSTAAAAFPGLECEIETSSNGDALCHAASRNIGELS